MRPYGVTKKDQGCCPGHDKFPKYTYNNKQSKKAQTRDTKIAHKKARRKVKQKIKCEEEKNSFYANYMYKGDPICQCGKTKEDEEGTHCYECGIPIYGENWFVGD